jgi:glutathione S-transferase
MSTRPILVIGNRNYSSWSLRAWLAATHLGLAFDEVRIPLDTPEFGEQIRRWSAAARVPVLVDGDVTVWDSLAICEYVAERTGEPGWPEAPALRAHARSSVAEMHSGFAALRAALPMNLRARRRVTLDAATEADAERCVALWCEALTLHDGAEPWLYGRWSIADAFWTPVVMRFLTYGVPIPELCRPWLDAVLSDEAMRAWCADAERETEVLDAEEVGETVEED